MQLPPKNAHFEDLLRFFEEFIDQFLVTGIRPSVEEHVAIYSLVHDLDLLQHCVPDFLLNVPPHLPKYRKEGSNIDMAIDMHDLLKMCFSRHLKNNYESVILDSLTDEALLHLYGESWRIYTERIEYLCRVFAQLNQRIEKLGLDPGGIVNPGQYSPTVHTLAMVQWERIMLDPVEPRLQAIGRKVDENPKAFKPDNLAMVKLAFESRAILCIFGINWHKYRMFRSMVFKDEHEAPFLKISNLYFKAMSESYIAEHGLIPYLTYALEQFAQEEKRAKRFLCGDLTIAAVRKKFLALCNRGLLLGHAAQIEALSRKYVDEGDEEGMRRLYTPIASLPEVSAPMRKVLEAHIRLSGLQMVKEFTANVGGPSKESHTVRAYVERLVEIHGALSERLGRIFGGDMRIAGCVESAFRGIVSQNAFTGPSATRGAELLAKQADVVLRKSKDFDESGRRSALDQVIKLLRFAEQKDVFQFYYTKALSMRLINGTSASEVLENHMVHALRALCGSEYTKKLQRMLTEKTLSEELSNDFKDRKRDRSAGSSDINFSVMVLNSNTWPLRATSDNFIIPQCILPTLRDFEQVFHKKHTGRKLNWMWNYSRNEVHTNYTTQKHILSTSSYQMAVLIQYNDHDSLMPEELVKATGLREEVLKQVLTPLVKAKILLQDREGDSIDFNPNFAAKKIKINVIQPVKTEVEAEADKKELGKSLEIERKYVLQATIVRLMKTHKKMGNQQLIHEVTAQISQRFVPRVPDIKAAIDALLELEYIERADGERETFVYAA